MKYPLLFALIFLNIAIATSAMEQRPRKIKLRSISSPVPRLPQNLSTLEQPKIQTPGKRPSPNTDKVLEEYNKKNELPSPRPGSPKSSPRLMSPRITSPRRSTTTNSYDKCVIAKALHDSELILATKENK